MPYITKNNRKKFEYYLNNFPEFEGKGELEYVVFSLMRRYMRERAHRYSILHDVVYAVQHCADEFRRRFLDERENEARKINGDV